MAQPTLNDLYQKHGTQRAVYLDDYLAEKHAHAIPCGTCSRLLVVQHKPSKQERKSIRCPDCQAKQEAKWAHQRASER